MRVCERKREIDKTPRVFHLSHLLLLIRVHLASG